MLSWERWPPTQTSFISMQYKNALVKIRIWKLFSFVLFCISQGPLGLHWWVLRKGIFMAVPPLAFRNVSMPGDYIFIMFIKRFRSSLIPVDNRYPRIPLFPNSMESLVFAQKSSEYNGFLLTHWPLGNALKNENKTYQNYCHFLKRVWWFSYETGAGGLPRFLINIGWIYDWVPSGNKL